MKSMEPKKKGEQKMIGFETDNNRYYVNTAARIVTGGKLGEQVRRFRTMRCFEGASGYILFEDGAELKTSPVRKILSAANMDVPVFGRPLR